MFFAVFKERFEQLLKARVSQVETKQGVKLSQLEVAEIQQTLKQHLEKQGFFVMKDTEKPNYPDKQRRPRAKKKPRLYRRSQTPSQANWLSSKNIF